MEEDKLIQKIKIKYAYNNMKLLVHICCAPCFAYPYKRLIEEGHSIVGYWYNPNIHPYMEYKARMDSLIKYAQLEDVEVIYDDYDFIGYLKYQMQHVERPDRCIRCYEYRLEKTTKYAKEHNFDAFTTTLLVSHYQLHDLVKKVGEEICRKKLIGIFILNDNERKHGCI